jgi:hypothetical protein
VSRERREAPGLQRDSGMALERRSRAGLARAVIGAERHPAVRAPGDQPATLPDLAGAAGSGVSPLAGVVGPMGLRGGDSRRLAATVGRASGPRARRRSDHDPQESRSARRLPPAAAFTVTRSSASVRSGTTCALPLPRRRPRRAPHRDAGRAAPPCWHVTEPPPLRLLSNDRRCGAPTWARLGQGRADLAPTTFGAR